MGICICVGMGIRIYHRRQHSVAFVVVADALAVAVDGGDWHDHHLLSRGGVLTPTF